MNRKRTILRISIIVLVLGVILLLCFGFTSRTVYLNGTLIEDGIESSATLTVTYRRIDSMFNNMHGNITIRSENDESLFEFTFTGFTSTLSDKDIYYAPISIYNEPQNWLDSANLYYDKDFKNVALFYRGISSVNQPIREFYSADDAFLALLPDMTDFLNPA